MHHEHCPAFWSSLYHLWHLTLSTFKFTHGGFLKLVRQWYLGLDPRTDEDIRMEKIGEIQIKLVVRLKVLYQLFLVLINGTWFHQMLTLEEAG